MEHTLGSSNWNLSTHFNIDGEVNFPGNCWSFNVDNSYCFDSFDASAFLDNIN